MDPQATWKAILELLAEGDIGLGDNRELLIDSLRNLADWLEKGGFFPRLEEDA